MNSLFTTRKRRCTVAISILALLALLSPGARGQQKQPVSSLQEDCGVTFNFTAASSGAQAAGSTTAGSTGTTAVIDNRQAGCLDWSVSYEPSSAVATLSLAFQTALDIGGVPVTWSSYPGTISSGVNPNTAITTGGAVTQTTGVQFPFLRMNLTALTGGRVQGKLIGWKRRPPASVVIAPGTLCTAGVPCPVDGPTAAGAAVAFPPVLVAGQDSGFPTIVRTLSLDPGGQVVVVQVTAGADGTNNATLEGMGNAGGTGALLTTAPSVFNGATWDRMRGNTTGIFVQGAKTPNAAVPGATNVGVLPCVANAAAPVFTEGFQVPCSVDLAGNTRVTGTVTITPAGTQNVNLFQVAGTATVTGGLPGTLGVGGLAAAGAAIAGNSVRIGGVDGGGLKRDLLMDTSGRPLVVGAAAAGAAIAGNPVAVGGTDGTNAAFLRVNTFGGVFPAGVTVSAADGSIAATGRKFE